MRRFIYQTHIFLGIFVSIPVLAWSLSGFLYALPNTIEGGTVERIAASDVRISPAEAINRAGELAGRPLPITSLTLIMREGRPQYQAIGGLGADSIFIDAQTGEASFSKPPNLQTRFFREAHFYFFAGGWQTTFLLIFSGLAALSAASGMYLGIEYLRRFPSRKNLPSTNTVD